MNVFSHSKTIAELENYLVIEQAPRQLLNNQIGNISLDSRQIKPSDLFIAVQGERNHGLDFLKSLLTKMPAAIVSDRALNKLESQLLEQSGSDVVIYIVADIQSQLGNLANWFYDQPSTKVKVVGITGTNGKTSSAFFTAQLLQSLGEQVAIMGTLGNGRLGRLKETLNTTPDAIQVHRLLAEFVKDGIDWVVMEVSSHALCLGRVQSIVFNCVALTQITRDHLDFHGSEQAYHDAKRLLFTDYRAEHKVLNKADAVGLTIFEQLAENSEQNVWLYNPVIGEERPTNLQLSSANLTLQGLEGTFSLDHQQVHFKAPLMGQFNIENVMCALSILLVNGFSLQQLSNFLSDLESVSGRMQIVGQEPTSIVDFAHTPDALEQVLIATKAHLSNNGARLILVFGCGGNRDKGKRPLMGRVAEQYADSVVVTSDNPRDESPDKIIQDILAGLKKPAETVVEVDRAKAIRDSLSQATSKDVLVIAGKGHEDYQEVKGVKIPYSDIAVIEEWFK